MRAIHLSVFVAGLLLVASLQSSEQIGADGYFKLKAEAKGRLSVTVDPKSGKITRAELSSMPKAARPGGLGISYRMIMADAKEIHDLAKSLDGQVVLVTGTVEIRESPPMNSAPESPILVFRVETLKAAPKAK